MDCQRDSQDLGHHNLISELRYTIGLDGGTGLDHAFIVHFDELICVMCD